VHPLKKDITNRIRLGIFISLGIALFTAGIYFIGVTRQMFTSTFRISGVFKDVGGLQAGNIVRFSGINVGTVENIKIISDTSVRVDMSIDEKVRKFIKKDAEAIIGSEGLLGNKILIITPGTGGKMEIQNNDTVKTVQPLSMDDILMSVKGTIDNAAKITGDVSKITGTIGSGNGTIGRLLMDKTMRENFDSTFGSLREGSAQFKTLMEKANTMGDILISLKATVDTTTSIAMDLSKITSSIQSGKGTIGGLFMDQSMRRNLDSTIVNLKDASAEFKSFLEKAKSSWLMWGF
jgi:phospholipid/cholesterol/gamma-HCH transport system substrate-binding protein